MSPYQFGQLLGFIALAETSLVFVVSTRARILILKAISDGLWSISYVLTYAYTGALIAGINVLRSLIFYQRDRHRWANNLFWPALFLCATAGAALLTWEGPISILPALGSMLAVLAFYNRNPHLTRLSSYVVQGLWLTYACVVLNYASIICNLVMMASATIGLIRERRAAAKEKSKEAHV